MDHSLHAVSVFNKVSRLYQEKFMDVSLYKDSFDQLFELIANEKASIIELACGPGNITKYCLEKNPNYKILGTDLAPNMIALAQQNNPTAAFKIMDCRKINTIEQKYDAIICGFCLPYLSDQETAKLISDSATILNPNGFLYLSTMEDDYSNSGYKTGSNGDQIFQHFYTEEQLNIILKHNQFTVVFCERIVSKMYDGTTVTDLVLIAIKD